MRVTKNDKNVVYGGDRRKYGGAGFLLSAFISFFCICVCVQRQFFTFNGAEILIFSLKKIYFIS